MAGEYASVLVGLVEGMPYISRFTVVNCVSFSGSSREFFGQVLFSGLLLQPWSYIGDLGNFLLILSFEILQSVFTLFLTSL